MARHQCRTATHKREMPWRAGKIRLAQMRLAMRAIPNRTLFVADNLRVMRGMDSDSVDLIATDPPFNSKRVFNAPLGSKAAKAKFDDRWRWDEVTDEWHDLLATDHPAIKELVEAAVVIEGGTKTDAGIETGVDNSIAAFVAWMAPRVVEMRRILKPSGTLYLQCDDVANSYLRLLLDAVFGRSNFRNEIIWQRIGNHNDAGRFGRTGDRLLFYGADIRRESVLVPLSDRNVKSKYRHRDGRGLFRRGDLTGAGTASGEAGSEWRGWNPTDIGRHWAVPRTGPYAAWIEANLIPGYRREAGVSARLDMLDEAGLVAFTATGTPELKRYLAASPGQVPPDIWTDIPPVNSQATERTGWPTQKPLALYHRIVKASSEEGDLVLDPFAGCATTCVAAEQLNRRWIGIDIDPIAETVTKDRLKKETGIFDIGDSPVTVRKNPPRRSDVFDVTDAKLRVVLWNNQGRRCANPYCTSESLRAEDLDLDHRIPKSRGGADDQSNRIGLCRNCNTRKGAKAWGTFLDESRARLPHPKSGTAIAKA